MITAARLGEIGYVRFVHQLERLGVLDRDSVREHLRLHAICFACASRRSMARASARRCWRNSNGSCSHDPALRA
jgi:hypothetical protein